MEKIKKYWIWIAIVVFGVIVFLPPIIHPEDLLIINNDTYNHLQTFKHLDRVSYLGQQIIGYPVNWINSWTGIGKDVLFMWINFGVIFLSGIVCGSLVYIISKSKLGAVLTGIIMTFGLGSTMHLFWSGTIFNVIEFLIILPVVIILVYKIAKTRNKWWFISGISFCVLMFFFHPSLGSGINLIGTEKENPELIIPTIRWIPEFFGIANVLLLIGIIWFYKKEENSDIGKFAVMILLTTLGIFSGIIAMTNITPFPSRAAINTCILFAIVMCIGLATVINRNNKKITYGAISLVVIGIIPNLVNWFTYTSFYDPMRGAY